MTWKLLGCSILLATANACSDEGNQEKLNSSRNGDRLAETESNENLRATSHRAAHNSSEYWLAPLMQFPYPESGAFIGQGWNSISGMPTSSSCVSVDVAPLETTTYNSQAKRIQSSLEIEKRSSFSANVSGFGGSAGYKSNSQNKINSDDQNFMLSFESSHGSTFAVPPDSMSTQNRETFFSSLQPNSDSTEKINTTALLLASSLPIRMQPSSIEIEESKLDLLDKDPAQFALTCGDGFVAALHRGVRIDIVLSQRYTSLDSKNSFSAYLGGSGFGVSGSAATSREYSKATAQNELSYSILQEGGMPLLPKSIGGQSDKFDVGQLLPQPEHFVSNPNVWSMTVIPYGNISSREELRSSSTFKYWTVRDYYIVLSDIYEVAGQVLEEAILLPSDGTYDAKMIDAFGGMEAIKELRSDIREDLLILERAIFYCNGSATTNCDVDLVFDDVVHDAQKKHAQVCHDKVQTRTVPWMI